MKADMSKAMGGHFSPEQVGARKEEEQNHIANLSPQQRILQLMDADTFFEIGPRMRPRYHNPSTAGKNELVGDGVVCGFGEIDGQRVYVYSQDRKVYGGSLGATQAEKIVRVMDLAGKTGSPLVCINDSAGARIQEGIEGLAGYGEIFTRIVRHSGVIPQISLVFGPCAGGAAYSTALTDFVIMVDGTSYMFVTGPKVLKAATGEVVDLNVLGGARIHAEVSGVAHFLAKNEQEALKLARRILSYFPPNNRKAPPVVSAEDPPRRSCRELAWHIPHSTSKAYDVERMISSVVDTGSFLEVSAGWAKNVRVGLARLGGHPIGVVANNQAFLGGALDSNAARKAARFVRTCNAFGIPLVTLVDVPGFLPGAKHEHGGIIEHGAKLAYAYCEATVPKVSVILGKAYGGAYIVMSSKHVGGDINLAWPRAKIAVMGAKAAVELLHAKDLVGSPDSQAELARLAGTYESEVANFSIAESRGFIDAVINPADTRTALWLSLKGLIGKRQESPHKRNGNIPL